MSNSLKNTYNFLRYILINTHWSLWLVGVLGMGVALLEVWSLRLIGDLIDAFVTLDNTSDISSLSLFFAGNILLMVIGNLGIHIVNEYAREKTSEKSILNVMDETIKRPILEVESEIYQRKLSLIKGTINNAILTFSSGIRQISGGISKIIGYIVAIQLFYSFAIYLLIVIMVIPILLLKLKAAKRGRDVSWLNTVESRKATYNKGLILSEYHSEEVNLLKLEKEFIDRWTKYRNIAKHRELDHAVNNEKINFIIKIIQPVGLLCFIFLIWLTKNAEISAGQVVFLLGACTQIMTIAESLAVEFVELYNNSKIFNDLNFFSKEKNLASNANEHTSCATSSYIQLSKVSLKYDTNVVNALNDISLNIKKGEKIAVIGPNGAGKTSLFLAILGLIKPDQGSITVNSTNPFVLSSDEKAHLFSCVFQKYGKYKGLSIKENILLDKGNLKVLDSQLIPDELDIDKIVGNDLSGVDLSGGQWQRVALARAAAAKGDIVILDEPTSSLDPIAEYEIINEFLDLVKDKTVILSSHRLGITLSVDRIFVLDRGMIVEYGKIEELLENDGLFRKMFDAQASLYRGMGGEAG